MPVRGLRRPGLDGIDDDHRRSRLLRLPDEAPEVKVGDYCVGPPEHDEASVGDVLREDALVGAHGHRGARGAGAGADRALQASGAQPREEAAVDALALDQPLGPHVAVGQHCLSAVLGHDLPQPPGDLAQRLLPGDPLEAPLALRTGAAQWVEQPLLAIHAVEVVVDLGAETAVGEGVDGVAGQLDRAAVLDRHLPRAGVGAVVWASALYNP